MMNINKITTIFALLLMVVSSVGCNKFLDKEPYSVAPEAYFSSADQLGAYALPFYEVFPTSGNYDIGDNGIGDNNTDNQTAYFNNDFWLPGQRKVPHTGNWDWKNIYSINYFFEKTLPKYEAGEIKGDANSIDHYIGEMYFFRAYEYFGKLSAIGDAPIILNTIVDQKDPLLEASVRQPRNLVARQIIKDLDLAIDLLEENPNGGTNRVNKNVALLFKSRVALYEASWERNFRGTAFVPNGDGWPGKATHPSYAYDADTEINYFLDEALEASKIVADAIPLSDNPAGYDHVTGGSISGANPYYEMFGTQGQGLSKFREVLLFRAFDKSLNLFHYSVWYLISGGGTGYNHQYMENFLMANGLPIYDDASGYKGDREVKDMKEGRDTRFNLFVQASGESLNDGTLKSHPVPALLEINELKSTTGYVVKKGAAVAAHEWEHSESATGSIVFRGGEAYLNYIEAYYLKHGSIGGDADRYWKAIRRRANVDEDYMKTVNATIMTEEAKVDLAAYTAGNLITALEYNIRRERRSEFIAEGFRWNDLKRYRALDQLISKRVFMPQGFNLWDHYHTVKPSSYYDGDVSKLIAAPLTEANVSENANFTINGDQMEGKYLYPLRVSTANSYFDGYKFTAAHYLAAIGVAHLLNAVPSTTQGGVNVENSVIYQNPGWTITAGDSPIAVTGFN